MAWLTEGRAASKRNFLKPQPAGPVDSPVLPSARAFAANDPQLLAAVEEIEQERKAA